MREDLIVEIPERYKESFEDKFNIDKIEYDAPLYRFPMGICDMCEEHKDTSNTEDIKSICIKCPFGKYGYLGCHRWFYACCGGPQGVSPLLSKSYGCLVYTEPDKEVLIDITKSLEWLVKEGYVKWV